MKIVDGLNRALCVGCSSNARVDVVGAVVKGDPFTFCCGVQYTENGRPGATIAIFQGECYRTR